jgi:hypothetical protein
MSDEVEGLRSLLRRWMAQVKVYPCSGMVYLAPCEDETLVSDTCRELGE